MKIFNIKVVKKRVFNILADTFPKLSTLLFNVYYNYSIVVTKIIQKMKSFTTLKMTQAFILNQSFLKVTQKCSSNIKAGTLKITYTFKSRIKESVNFIQNLSVNAIAKMRVKASLALTTTFDMVTDALVGKFRLLGELDPYYLVAQLKYNTFVNNGKTTQSGTGDPSPTNIRPIYGVGQYDKKIIFDGTEPWRIVVSGHTYLLLDDSIPDAVFSTNLNTIFSNAYKSVSYEGRDNNNIYVYFYNAASIGIVDDSVKSIEEWKKKLSEAPLTAYYQSTSYATATQVYCGLSITDANGYHGYAAGPMAPLFDGDTLDFVSGEVMRNSYLLVFDGVTSGKKADVVGTHTNGQLYAGVQLVISAIPNSAQASSHYNAGSWSQNNFRIYIPTANNCFITDSRFTNLTTANGILKAQYDAGTPVTLLYNLATPTTETVPISEPIANTTGQTTIVVENTYTTATTPINGLDDLTLGELDFQSANI